MAGCARNRPESPPETKSETKPSAKSIEVVKRIWPPHSVPSQLKVLMAEGTPMLMVSIEKREGRVGAHAADKHVMAPDRESEESDGEHGVDHRAIAEDRLARERGEKMRGHAHAGKNGDVNLGMAEEPKEVLPKNR